MKDAVRSRALELGFDACRFTDARVPDHVDTFHRWLRDGCHGGMAYLERTRDRRSDPQLVLPGARTIIVLAVSYSAGPNRGGAEGGDPGRGVVARYARHTDYHDVVGARLRELRAYVDTFGNGVTRSLEYLDTGPILERSLAHRAGLGFIGKHTNLIGHGLGNWILLAAILTTLPIEPDPAAKNRCGTCVRCLAACPTGAITEPFRLDARRCISYLTIEHRGPIPEELRPLMGRRIFGCDDCLAACPWNRFAVESRMMRDAYRGDLDEPSLMDLLALGECDFRARFRGTPFERTKRRGLLRNVAVALGNVGGPEALPGLHLAARDPEPLIAEHASWAIGRIEARTGGGRGGGRDGQSACSSRLGASNVPSGECAKDHS